MAAQAVSRSDPEDLHVLYEVRAKGEVGTSKAQLISTARAAA